MIFTTEHIKDIKQRLEYLEEHFNIDTSDNLCIFEDDDIEELIAGINEISINFPDEGEDIAYSSEDFWKYTSDLENIKMIDNSTVRDNTIRQTILNIDEFDYNKYEISKHELIANDCIIRIIDNPFYIGLVASKEGFSDDNYCITSCSMYKAVEIEYLSDNRLSQEEEDNLIDRFLFFVSARTSTCITVGEFFEFPDDFYDHDDDEQSENDKNEKYQFNIDDTPKYTQAMQYYVDALSIKNNEIKLLYFYKIIEYFAPLVSKKKSYELLNQRLDTISLKSRDHKDLESIFQLTRQHDISIQDRELANTVLCECIDILELFEYLPNSFISKIVKTVNFKKEEYRNLKTDKVLELKKELGKFLYSTRNSIVHAKPNYKSTGYECPDKDLESLNIFMSKMCQCLIIWNSRQAKEFQI